MTARLIAPYVQVDARDIHYISALYEAEEKDWVQLARSLDDNKSCVMMVGHNEGLTDFVNRMTGYLSENIPTSGMVIIDFAIDHWSELKTGCCIDYFFPRRGRG
jgi:phosphohistidine phosphatase